MANLGNAWHIPQLAELPRRGTMLDPVGALVPGTTITVFNGNQFRPPGNAANQLEADSDLIFKRVSDANWTRRPLRLHATIGPNQYFAATIPADVTSGFQEGDVVQYYLQIAYANRDRTFLHESGALSVTTENEATAQARPFTFVMEARATRGLWGPVFELPNVAIHASLLPTGSVLMWGRRVAGQNSLDPHECTPFCWDPVTDVVTDTPQPTQADRTLVNLFCAGHTFLPDGRLLVVGGHLADSDGISLATIYDAATNTWQPTAPMTDPRGNPVRRWYPTAVALPNGTVLVLSGSYIDNNKQIIVADLLQVWDNGVWKTIARADGQPLNFFGLPLYPRMHIASAKQRIFMSGTNAASFFLKTSVPGQWQGVGNRAMNLRDYCPAVSYDVDKLLYIGGGNAPNTFEPTDVVEAIDLVATNPQWRRTGSMNFPRRQHNATVLPDGTVLVTGGTRGGGGPNKGFNDLRAGQPVHEAELWNPATETWTVLAAEEVDRCYHSVALLLPDARVLSAGGGEYRPVDGVNAANAPADTHRNAQIFSPPYLFKGKRPTITSAPTAVRYQQQFEVITAQASEISRASWLSLPSVTHAFDQNQRISFENFPADSIPTESDRLTITAPDSPDACPPGFYMLFILNRQGVPSVAEIIQIEAPEIADDEATDEVRALAPLLMGAGESAALLISLSGSAGSYRNVYSTVARISKDSKGTMVEVGITGTCPYGIGACWGGAYETLQRLEFVDKVVPVPNTNDSTAEVFLKDKRLPPLELWNEQFQEAANGTYLLRGVEVALHGRILQHERDFILEGINVRSEVQLMPLEAVDKIQWDKSIQAPKPQDESELSAYGHLIDALLENASRQFKVTGPLRQTETGSYQLFVRLFE